MLSDYPNLVNEWDYEKNNNLNIDDFSHGSNKKVGWKCTKGHFWDATIKSRARLNRGCSQCAGKMIVSLDKSHPELKKLWDYDKNDDIKNYTAGMHKKVAWRCKRSHSWEAKIFYMVRRKEKGYCLDCRMIDNDRFLSKEEYPDLFSEWDFEKNVEDFTNITKGSNKKLWWRCPKNHSYPSDIPSRIRGRGCSICAGRKQTTLSEDFPNLVKEWNDIEDINNFTSGSMYPAQWKCSKNHIYQEVIRQRVKHKGCPICEDRVFTPFYHLNEALLKEWDYEKNTKLDPKTLSKYSHKESWWKCDKNHSWKAPVYSYYRGARCYKCWADKKSSKGEEEVSNYILTLMDKDATRHNKNIITPHELDIYIPEKKIAIEFNGLYWHSEAVGKDKNYHFNKWKKCQEQGIQLITIWEDDWRDNREVVESMLKYKLGLSNEKKVYARKTFVKEVSSIEAEAFLNQHHIQGFKNITKNYGLFSRDGDELVAVMSFSVSKNVASLDRYATSCSVVGGFTKLLKYAVVEMKKDNSEVDSVITFADNEISDGGLYTNNGFVADSYIKPDYKYIYKNRRYHKFLFRKKRFKNDPELLFDENMTERELADLNNIHRVWDCGKTKYVKKI